MKPTLERGPNQTGAKRPSFLVSASTQVPACGFESYITAKSKWCVMRVGIKADPRKTDDWAKRTEAIIGPHKFAMEYGLTWGVSSNLPFYHEYQTRGGDETFVRRHVEIGKGPVLVGLDFGQLRPAIVLGQTNAKRTRLHLLREWSPLGIAGPAFAEVCGWLCGWFPLSRVSESGLQHVYALRKSADAGEGPAVPWIDWVATESHRYASHEALRNAAEVASESHERNTAAIWAAKGMPLSVGSFDVSDSAGAIRHLLRLPPPNAPLPYLVIDPWCELIIRAFNGGYTFARATKANPHPNKPFKDGVYEHLMDALRYLVNGFIDIKTEDNGVEDEPIEAGVVKPDPVVQGWRYNQDRDGQSDAGSAGFSTPMSESDASGDRWRYERD